MARHSNLWVILTIREDYVAGLEPYSHLAPNRLRARFYMQRMGIQSALAAVEQPAASVNCPFAPGVARKLVDNLRMVRTAGDAEYHVGEYVEPVQLQVVCFQLWEDLQVRGKQAMTIEMSDLEHLAGGGLLAEYVDRALSDFYDRAIAKVLEAPDAGVSEQMLRSWFSTRLITEAGTRSIVFRNESTHETEGLPNRAVDLLTSLFLLRTELRAGGAWVELVHDRFIEPIRVANLAWFTRNLNPLTRAAQAWDASGRDPARLYAGSQLAAAVAEMRTQPKVFGALEKEFLDEAQKAEDRRAARRQRRITAASIALALLFLTLAAWALFNRSQAQMAANSAATAERHAELDAAAAARAQVAAEDGATQVAANLQSYQKALGVQLGYVDQLATVSARNAALNMRLQTAEAGSAAATILPPAPGGTSVARNATQTAVALAGQRMQVQSAQTAVAGAASAGRPILLASVLTDTLPRPTETATPAVQAQQLTTGPGRDYSPVYAPSGQQIAFFSDRSGAWKAYLLSADGQVTGPLFGDNGEQYHPHFSPQGDRLVFASNATGQWEIYVSAANDYAQPRQLTRGPGGKVYPVFSPDGNWIAFTWGLDGHYQVGLMRADGSEVRALTNTPGYNGVATFSPDGQRLAFQTDRDGNQEIYTMDRSGGDLRRLTRHPRRDANPVWSPDGKWIAFESDRDGNNEIYIMRPDGSGLRNVTQTSSNEWAPGFSPDGRWLVYQSDRSGETKLWRQAFEEETAQ